MKTILMTCLVLSAWAGGQSAPKLEGDVPRLVTQDQLNLVWDSVKLITGVDAPAPTIHFETFDESRMSPERKAFIAEWGRRHPEIPLPFPKSMQGFFFEGTGSAQVSPAVFTRGYVSDPYTGQLKDPVGFGYYSVGHEMLHYAFEQKGVPIGQHHCLFITGGEQAPSERLAALLSDAGLSNMVFMRRDGLNVERMMDPCGELSKPQ